MFPCFSVAFFLFLTVTQASCVLKGGGSIRQCPPGGFWAAWGGVRDLCRQWLDVGRSTTERALVPVEGSCKSPENDCYWLVPCDAYEGLYIAIAIAASGVDGVTLPRGAPRSRRIVPDNTRGRMRREEGGVVLSSGAMGTE
ncbi:hypothetical protein TgHK011_007294 [Trichoderma gracile]|nr:hypothetical protein TgHK011_007294 [Trichoderma gracile]